MLFRSVSQSRYAAEEIRILQEKLEDFGNKMITEFDCFDPVYFKGQDLLFYLNQELG